MKPDQIENFTVEELAALLTQFGAGGGVRVDPDTIRADIREGAPANPDGTINLVHYTAWLAKRVK